MFKVFTGDGRQYVGFSERLARDFFDAAVKSGRRVLILRRDRGGFWIELDEFVPSLGCNI